MTILVRIVKISTGLWDLDSVLLSTDGVLGMPYKAGFPNQAAAVLYLRDHLDACCGAGSTFKLFYCYESIHNIDRDLDLNIEVSIPAGYGFMPTLRFDQGHVSSYSNSSSSLADLDGEEIEEKKESSVDLLKIMTDICSF